MEFPTISRSGIIDDNSRLFPEIPTGLGTLYLVVMVHFYKHQHKQQPEMNTDGKFWETEDNE